VALGNIRVPKDYPTLLEAVAQLRDWPQPLPPFVVEIAGAPDGGTLYTGLLAQREALGVDALVRFAGFVDDAPGFLAGADGFVLSSRQEGFSLATIEAMLAGVPVVVTRCGGPEALVDDGVTGVLVPPGDPAALAGALAALLQDPDDAAARAARARAASLARYTVDAMMAGYLGVYEARDPT
jgi:glycosyltransferase involved in cell wall biosynthesis